MGIFAAKPIMDETEKKVRHEIDEQIANYKILMISKKSCPFCRTAKVRIIFHYSFLWNLFSAKFSSITAMIKASYLL